MAMLGEIDELVPAGMIPSRAYVIREPVRNYLKNFRRTEKGSKPAFKL